MFTIGIHSITNQGFKINFPSSSVFVQLNHSIADDHECIVASSLNTKFELSLIKLSITQQRYRVYSNDKASSHVHDLFSADELRS